MQTALKPQTEETIDTGSKVLLTRVPLKLGKLRILGIQASRDVTSLKPSLTSSSCLSSKTNKFGSTEQVRLTLFKTYNEDLHSTQQLTQ